MNDEIKEFRDGIFALRTRRFGTVAELMIEALYSFTKSHNQFHDRYDEVGHQRIEIKFFRSQLRQALATQRPTSGCFQYEHSLYIKLYLSRSSYSYAF